MTRRQVQFMESICNGTFNDDREIDDFIEACAKYSSKRPNKGPESPPKPLNRQEAHNSPANIEQREEIAKLKAEIKEANEHIETLANKLLDSKSYYTT